MLANASRSKESTLSLARISASLAPRSCRRARFATSIEIAVRCPSEPTIRRCAPCFHTPGATDGVSFPSSKSWPFLIKSLMCVALSSKLTKVGPTSSMICGSISEDVAHPMNGPLQINRDIVVMAFFTIRPFSGLWRECFHQEALSRLERVIARNPIIRSRAITRRIAADSVLPRTEEGHTGDLHTREFCCSAARAPSQTSVTSSMAVDRQTSLRGAAGGHYISERAS